MSGEDCVDLDVYCHRATARAWLVSDSGEEDDAVWVPRSQCGLDCGEDEEGTLSIPTWLAEEKGLL